MYPCLHRTSSHAHFFAGTLRPMCSLSRAMLRGVVCCALDHVRIMSSVELWPEDLGHYTIFISPCIYLFTVHYCALPIEAETGSSPFDESSDTESTSSVENHHTSGPNEKTSLTGTFGGSRPRRNRGFIQSLSRSVNSRLQGFNGCLLCALVGSALLNALVGAFAYVFYMQETEIPRDPQTGQVRCPAVGVEGGIRDAVQCICTRVRACP